MALIVVISFALAWLQAIFRAGGDSLLGFEDEELDLGIVGMATVLAVGAISGLHRRRRGLAVLLFGSAVVLAYAVACWVMPERMYEMLITSLEPVVEAYLRLVPAAAAEDGGPELPLVLWPLILLAVALVTLPQMLLAVLGAYTLGSPLITLLGFLIARSGPLADEVVARHRRVVAIERQLERTLGELEELKRIVDGDRPRG